MQDSEKLGYEMSKEGSRREKRRITITKDCVQKKHIRFKWFVMFLCIVQARGAGWEDGGFIADVHSTFVRRWDMAHSQFIDQFEDRWDCRQL